LETVTQEAEGIPQLLKQFKANVGNPRLDRLERIVVRALRLWPEQLGDWVGETWHQVGLRAAARQEWAEARECFDRSRRSLASPLALARLERDDAWAAAIGFGEFDEALRRMDTAFAHHERDRGNVVKAKRQRLITETYRLRIAWYKNPQEEYAQELVRILDHQGRSFCHRDQMTIVEFLAPLLTGSEKIMLDVRAAELHARQLRLRPAVHHAVVATINFDLLLLRWIGKQLRRE
jgi:hypothetical protein